MKTKLFLGFIAMLLVMPVGLAWSDDTPIAGRCEEAWILAQEAIEPAEPTETVEGGMPLGDLIGDLDWWNDIIGSELDDDAINSLL